MTPRISVVICTHNRATYLKKALESLIGQSLPAAEFEVLVIDNGSTDSTKESVQKFVSRLPNLRYCYEGRLGLSWARNTGAAACSSPYVVYLDDDARALPDWLRQMLRAFEETTPSPACVGGRVWLDWEGDPPAWLPASCYVYYSHLDLGAQSRFLGSGESVVGANMAFRRDVLEQCGGFSTELGRVGASLLSCEEADLLGRISARGLPVYYAADATVWHTVPRARQRRRWFLSRVYWEGVSHTLQGQAGSRSRLQHLRQACSDVRHAGRFFLRYCRSFLGAHKGQRYKHLVDFLMRVGRIRTLIVLARRPRQPNPGREAVPPRDAPAPALIEAPQTGQAVAARLK